MAEWKSRHRDAQGALGLIVRRGQVGIVDEGDDRRDLLGTDSFHTMMSASGAYERRATELGEQFLRFIAKPDI